MVGGKLIIGNHSSISGGGVLGAVKFTRDIGGTATQIFLGSNQSSSLKMKTKLTPEQIKEINKWIHDNNHILIAHCIYLLNLCSYPPNSKQIKYMFDNILYDLNRIEELGGVGCVLHIGVQKTLSREEAYKNMIDNVIYITQQLPTNFKTKLILETPAGQGTQIATTLDELAELWDAIPLTNKRHLGICIDTAHIFSSGVDIRTSRGVKKYLMDFEKKIGLKYLTCFHINDSKEGLNSRKDRHEGIGSGYIFDSSKGGDLGALYTLTTYAMKHKIPMILETHSGGYYGKNEDKYRQEIELFNRWGAGDKKFKISPQKGGNDISDSDGDDETYIKYGGGCGCCRGGRIISYKTNNKIIEIFQKLYDYYGVIDDKIHMNVYKNAINIIRKLDFEIKTVDDLKGIKGIGKGLKMSIDEIITTNKLKKLDELDINDDYRKQQDLMKVLGIGKKKAEELIKQGIESVDNLKRNPQKVKLNYQQEIGVKYFDNLNMKILRKESEMIRDMVKMATAEIKLNTEIYLVGSYPAGSESSKDVDILLVSKGTKTSIIKNELLKKLVNYLKIKKVITEILWMGDIKFMGLVKVMDYNRHLDMTIIPEKNFPFTYLHMTSGGDFNQIMRRIARRAGYKLNEWYIKKNNATAKPIYVKDEREIFDLIGMEYVPVEKRRNYISKKT